MLKNSLSRSLIELLVMLSCVSSFGLVRKNAFILVGTKARAVSAGVIPNVVAASNQAINIAVIFRHCFGETSLFMEQSPCEKSSPIWAKMWGKGVTFRRQW